MPRGRRKTSSEKLSEIREAIEGLEKQLQERKMREKELLREKREEELGQLAEILEARNLTPGDLAGILDQINMVQYRTELSPYQEESA